MITETGRVVSVEPEGLWVETIQKTVCGSCKAEQGCGQRLLNDWTGHTAFIWVLLEGREPKNYQRGDMVQIAIPDDVIVKGSLFVYMVPVLMLVAATSLAHSQFANDLVTTFSGLAGLVLGGLIVRWHSWHNRYNREFQPVLIDETEPLRFAYPHEAAVDAAR